MTEIKSVSKNYGDKNVFNDFSLNIEDHKITVILGESGSGKTTLLKMIAKLTEYDGEIKNVGKIAMVFQRDRLVDHLTVEENLRLIAPDADVKNLLESVGLSGTERLYPKDLSAGMARRVAILRAFCYDADLTLMDEPLVNLDLALKYALIDKIKELKEKHGKTVLFVTHDVKEASLIADRIIVIKSGKIVFERDCENKDKAETERSITEVLLDGYGKSISD